MKKTVPKFIIIELTCFVIFILIMGIIFGIIWLFVYKTQDQTKFLLGKSLNQKPTFFLSLAQWYDIRSKYLTLVDDQNPRVALEQLRQGIKTDDLLSKNCHELTHEIGHEAFNKYKTFGNAIQFQDEVCNSGYMHGVLESYFNANKNNILFALKNACREYGKNNYAAWECYHGIGHGVMFATSNDVPKSISLCGSFTDNFSYFACTNGIFMQNFNSDQFIHPSKFLSAQNFFYPCYQQKFQDMPNCYTYAPSYFLSLHKYNYPQALDWCNKAPYLFISACAYGVGSEAIKQNVNNPSFAEKICFDAPENEQKSCLTGVISLYALHYGSILPSENLCKEINSSNKPICEKAINSLRSLFL